MQQILNTEEIENKVQIAIIGDHDVGKTSFLKRYCQDYTSYSTVELEFKKKSIFVDEIKIDMTIFDISFNLFMNSLYDKWIKKNQGIILMYSIGNRKSFDFIDEMIMKMQDEMDENTINILVGNKQDVVVREVSYEEGLLKGKKRNMQFLETSVLTGKNVEESFYCLIKEMIEKSRKGIKLNRSSLSDNGCC